MKLPPIMFLPPAFAVLVAAARAQTVENDRWRFDGDAEIAQLVRASTEGTDMVGRFSFKCRAHSGEVETTIILDKGDLGEIGDLIKRDGAPEFRMLPDLDNLEFKIESNNMYGWTMLFTVDAGSEFMRSFGRSGQLRYRLGKTTRQYGTTAGKDDAAAFFDACSKK